MDNQEIDGLIEKMINSEDNAFKYSNTLAKIGGSHLKEKMLALLGDQRSDVRHLAARTLGKMDDKADVLDHLLVAINRPEYHSSNGGMVEALEDFDCSAHFVDIFRLYLSPNWKISGLAKLILDFEEFDITPRVLRKAEKHWQHYSHNTKHDEGYEAKKLEVDEIFRDIKALLDA